MKRVLVSGLLVGSMALAYSASAANRFVMTIDPTRPARTGVNVSIAAYNDMIFDNGYYDTVTFTASVSGQPANFTPPISGNFSGGNWTGSLLFYTAGDVTLTCAGLGGATGNTMTVITPAGVAKLLILVPGQTYTPGFNQGVSPTTYVHLLQGSFIPVTVYATDADYNWVNNYSTAVNMSFSGGSVLTANPFSTTEGRAFFTVQFTEYGGIDLYANTPSANAFTTKVIVDKTTEAFLYITIPQQAIAGGHFYLSATVSSSSIDPAQSVNSADGFYFRINRLVGGTSDTPAPGNWGPNDAFTVVNAHFYQSDFTYDRVGTIYVCGEKISGGTMPVIGRNSNLMQIFPNVPGTIANSLLVDFSPSQIQAQHSSRIRAQVLDQYGNPTRSSLYPFVVNFRQVQGNGYLSLTQTTADDAGFAYCDFTGGNVNEQALVEVTVQNTSTQQVYNTKSVTIQVSVTSPEKGAILNYPNPFNPEKNQTTSINYYLESASNIEIKIYDAFGRLVISKTLGKDDAADEACLATAAGGAFWKWDGRNGGGKIVGNGIYLVKITARGSTVQEFKRRVGVLK